MRTGTPDSVLLSSRSPDDPRVPVRFLCQQDHFPESIVQSQTTKRKSSICFVHELKFHDELIGLCADGASTKYHFRPRAIIQSQSGRSAGARAIPLSTRTLFKVICAISEFKIQI